LNLESTVIELSPRDGDYVLKEQDILDIIEREGPSIAIVLFSGVQYYTGQYFPIESITRKAKAQVSKIHVIWLYVCLNSNTTLLLDTSSHFLRIFTFVS
jgi:kynureninase